MLAIAVVGIVFVFIGNMNTLGPVVTMPFMITYAAVDYAYFVLAVSYDRVSKRHELLGVQEAARKANEKQTTRGYGTLGGGKTGGTDLDNLFPSERDPLRDRMGPVQKEADDTIAPPNNDHEADHPGSDTTSIATSGADSSYALVGQHGTYKLALKFKKKKQEKA